MNSELKTKNASQAVASKQFKAQAKTATQLTKTHQNDDSMKSEETTVNHPKRRP